MNYKNGHYYDPNTNHWMHDLVKRPDPCNEGDLGPRKRISVTFSDIEEYEAQAMLKALDMSSAIDWFANHLRNLDKHGDFETQEARQLIERLRHEFYTEVVSEVPED